MSAARHGIVEVNCDPVRDLRKGLLAYRNKFCDVRLWVENHAIPAHKLILSLHSSFFEQMFNSGSSESASEVYLNDVRYNVLYPIIEFMYTGRAYIDSTDVFDEIKAFSRSINFQPFSTLWYDSAPPTTNAPNIHCSPVHTSMSALMQPMSSNSLERNCIASTQATSCFSAARMSSTFAPALASTPVSTHPPSPLQQRFSDFATLDVAPTTFASTSTSNSYTVPLTPPTLSTKQSSSLFQLPGTSMECDFLGFSPSDVASDFPQYSYAAPPAINRNDAAADSVISPPPMNPVDPNATDSIIELSEITQSSQLSDSNNNEVIEIDETEVEIVPQMASVSKTIRGRKKSTSGKKEIAAKPKARRGRPKKVLDDTDDSKLYVSSKSLFKKTKPSQRGRKNKTPN